MPSRADLRIYQGDDYSATVTVNGGVPADVLAGYAARAQIREGAADDYPIVVELAVEIVSPVIKLALAHDVTATLLGQYVWDLQVTDADGVVSTILAGNVIVTREVTREP